MDCDWEILLKDLKSGHQKEIAGQLLLADKSKGTVETSLIQIKENDLELMDHYVF